MSCSFILKSFTIHFLGTGIVSAMSTVQSLSISVSLTVKQYCPIYGLYFNDQLTQYALQTFPPLVSFHLIIYLVVLSRQSHFSRNGSSAFAFMILYEEYNFFPFFKLKCSSSEVHLMFLPSQINVPYISVEACLSSKRDLVIYLVIYFF